MKNLLCRHHVEMRDNVNKLCRHNTYKVGINLENEKRMRSAVCEMPHIMACIGCSGILAWYNTNPMAALVADDMTKVVRRPINSTQAAENL